MILFNILQMIRFHYILTNSVVISFWNKYDSADVQTKRKRDTNLFVAQKASYK